MRVKTPFACLLSCLLAPLALAQSGDRRGETQRPLPADLKVPPAPVLTPEEEHATFKLAPGFKAELVAADPLIGDPVQIQFGPDGRLWVLEMRGYMPNVDATNEREPIGVLAVLTDTDGDGRYDKRVEFADKLVLPRAFALVGDGALIGEPTNLWFVRDTDGDGKADTKTNVATDYGNTNNPEHNANGLMWAMDNWIYSANYTARFRWEGDGKFTREPTITRGQWGISQDDTGRTYHNSNSDPLRFDAVPSAYLRRNSFFSAAGTNIQLVPATLKIFPSRMTPGVNRGYRTLDDNYKLTAMTAACGPVVYRGALFPEEFRGDAFVAEPSANLIKRIKLSEKDGKVTGANVYEDTEFFTSTDERFRPVNLFNGPDGALYVVDFYRGIIQHKIYVTSFLRKQIEERGLDKGIHYGRIWRVAPDGATKANFKLGLAQASSADLVKQLGDANGWVRDTAQRLLVERRDPAVKAELAKAATDASRPALARLHALWALDGAKQLDRATVIAALRDPDPRVCAAAIRVSETFLVRTPAGGKGPAPEVSPQDARATAEVLARVSSLVKTRSEPGVRLQLAFTLGEARTQGTDEALRTLATLAGKQPYVADAIVSGLAARELGFIEALAKNGDGAVQAGDALRFAVSAVLKSADAKRIERVLALLTDDTISEPAKNELLAGVKTFLPKTPDGRTLPGTLPAEPKPLVALAAKTGSPTATTAQQLLASLRWPGKPGMTTTTARPLTPAEQALFDKGKAQFAALCAACHQPNGQGQPGLAPSLVYSRWVLGDPRVLARIVLNGKTKENLVMPPWKAALDDENVAAITTFVRRSWGNDADPMPLPLVAAARADTTDRDEPYSDADLDELVQNLGPYRQRRQQQP